MRDKTPEPGSLGDLQDRFIDVFGIAGAVTVAAGAGMIYLPAGVIVAGLFLLVAAWLLARKSRG